MKYEFRTLNASEIDCRVNTIKENGLTLLLYKDARVDMNILDEVVGSMNWQREHKELKGNIYCGVSLWDEEKEQWITKWDCGKESFSEAEKGEASDSFKRACVNATGVGRELYTAPFIWISAENCNIVQKGEKYTTNDTFRVKEIGYNDSKEINLLKIVNNKTNKVVFELGKAPTEKMITENQKEMIKQLYSNDEIKEYLTDVVEKKKLSELTLKEASDFIKYKQDKIETTSVVDIDMI